MLLFFCQHLFLDICKVVRFDIFTNFITNLFIVIKDSDPALFSDTEAFAVRSGSIAEYCSYVEGTIVGANKSFVHIANDKFLLFVNFKSDFYLTFLHENDLVDVI